MQAVILAAGKSTRTYPLTITRPKPLLKVANKMLLEHNLDNLRDIVSEVIIIVGYKKELIINHIGQKYKHLAIRYVEQKQQLGTAHALSIIEPYIKGRFVLMMGDDIYSRKDIMKCSKYNYSILAVKVKNPENFGVIIEKNGILLDIVEKPKKFISDLASAALYTFDRKIFRWIKKIKKSQRSEFEIPDAIKLLSKSEKVHAIKSKNWLPIAYPWDLLRADKILRKNNNNIGKNSAIYGKIKNSSIGSSCIIKGQVKDSIIMDNSIIDDGSIVESSIIGESVYFKGTINAQNNGYSIVKGKKIKAGKIGAIISDNCKLTNVNIKAGCKIGPNIKIKNKNIIADL